MRDTRFEELRPGFRRWLLRSITGLAFAMTATAISYGEQPALKVSATVRVVIAFVGCLSLAVFGYTGAMLLGERLLRRFSPAWREDPGDGV
jgi:hypothetical protein